MTDNSQPPPPSDANRASAGESGLKPTQSPSRVSFSSAGEERVSAVGVATKAATQRSSVWDLVPDLMGSQRKSNQQDHVNSALAVASESLMNVGHDFGGVHPWWDKEGKFDTWTKARQLAARFIFSQVFEGIMSIAIVANLIIIVIQTDKEAECIPEFEGRLPACFETGNNDITWLVRTNQVFVAFYSVEAACKLFVARWAYFSQLGNIIDGAVCISGIAAEFMSGIMNLNVLRVFRLWRIIRVLNSMARVPEINMLVSGLSGAIRAMFFGSFFLLLTLLFCSIILVQFIHPINVKIPYGPDCFRCSRGFRSVLDTILTLFQQVVAGDSWGRMNLEVIHEDPVTGCLLPMVQLLISMGMMNLILAVVVDRSAEARESQKEASELHKSKLKHDRMVFLLQTIATFDDDQSGLLSREELDNALRSTEIRNVLKAADIDQHECGVFIDALEASSKTGEVKYEDFCALINQIESADIRKITVMGQLSEQCRLHHHETVLQEHKEQMDRIESKVDVLLEKFVGRLEAETLAESMKSATSNSSGSATKANHAPTPQSIPDKEAFAPSQLSAPSNLAEKAELSGKTTESCAQLGEVPESLRHMADLLHELRQTSLHQHEMLSRNLKSSITRLHEQSLLLADQCNSHNVHLVQQADGASRIINHGTLKSAASPQQSSTGGRRDKEQPLLRVL
jgi:hypothetical protein